MAESGIDLHVRCEHWPLGQVFAISRGVRREAVTLVVEASCEGHVGRGEAVPYSRFGESPDSAAAAVRRYAQEGGKLDRESLVAGGLRGAARNALDCALWDLEAKRTGVPVWERAGLQPPEPVTTAYTISLGQPEAMARQAKEARERPLLKIKMGGSAENEAKRLLAVREAAPKARLVVDANEGWSLAQLEELMPVLGDAGVELIEQPLPAGQDGKLEGLERVAPLCADESCRTREDLAAVSQRYDYVNVKLDKAGGLTEALALCQAAREAGLGVFVGCMLAGSLAIAPALTMAPLADYVDLDGPLYMRVDREGGVQAEGSILHPPEAGFWGDRR